MSNQPLRARLRGEVIDPSHVRYDAARRVYNAMFDRHPRVIARCADVADVMACVEFARENTITTAIRGGGHNAAGLGVCDDGLVIDLSQMRGVRVDPAAKTVRVGGGCTWGDVDHATHAFGMATPSGIISTTGVGGLTLGGGIGHLTRKYGLTIDNLLSADVVLADGRFHTASKDENQDLFWAIRGGGGNFGVVTSFLFRLHPVDTVYAGPMLWPMSQAAAVMQCYRELITRAPEDLNGFFAFMTVPPAPPFPEELHGQKMCGIVWCHLGTPEQAEQDMKPLKEAAEPAFAYVGPIAHPALQGMFDPLYPPGLQWYWRADFVNELSDPAIEKHIQYGSKLPTPQSTMHLYPINGAVHRVGKNDTAFSYRDSTWAEVIVGVDPNPASRERLISWTRAYWDAVHPYSAGGAYVNFMMDEGHDRVRNSYGANYDRLAAIKRQYDPENFFRMNQNIKPVAAKASS